MKIAGVDELFEISSEQVKAIDHFTDLVLEHLFDDDEELEDALRGEQDSLAAADEDWSRWPR